MEAEYEPSTSQRARRGACQINLWNTYLLKIAISREHTHAPVL